MKSSSGISVVGFLLGSILILPAWGPPAPAQSISKRPFGKTPDGQTVAFTGEYTTGQLVMEAAAKSNLKRVSLASATRRPTCCLWSAPSATKWRPS